MGSATYLTSVIRHLGPSGDLSGDHYLLTRYATRRDAAAFRALVQRHGALVLGVARRHLGDRHRAEDVFQATFLVLARSAHRLGGRTGLADWLYVVALRQARKTHARTARREALERASVPHPHPDADPLVELTARELVRAIDGELARLAVPSVTRFDQGGYVGGASLRINSLIARGPGSAVGPTQDGTYGTDFGGFRAHLGRVFLASSDDPSRGRPAYLSYRADGPRIVDVFAIRPLRNGILAKREAAEEMHHGKEEHGAGGHAEGVEGKGEKH
ncbi:RNA polymerase sigma factor [Gemmata sp. G18]|uniref:RNA polymerase sigma factor n=1 Tax=Gemmata palustris TaxID=2822762 RepID=A0ABS5BT13_9BACT|nr:RNA polymerase sigma factor [Gemmata palustris]MBP3956868.1 RNA polymerase sigma factor [Gemmata palustris]